MKTLLSILALLYVQAVAGLCQTPYPLGWKPSLHGIKAPDISTHPKFMVAAVLPPTASVAQWYFATNQKQKGECVAWSTIEAACAAYAKDNNGELLILSAQDVYQQCLLIDGNFPNDDGTYGSTAIKVMMTSGALLEKTWPYDLPLNKLPKLTPAMKAERAQNMALKAYAVPNNDGGFATKQCVANLHIGVMIGSYWYNNTFPAVLQKIQTKDASGKVVTVSRFVVQYPKGSPVGGHEIVIIEYDDNMVFPDGSVGGVRIHNHWTAPGQPWGDSIGSAWIPYKWAFNPRIVEDKCAIEVMKPKAKKTANTSPIGGHSMVTTTFLLP